MNAVRQSVLKLCRRLNACDRNKLIENQNRHLLAKADMMTKEVTDNINNRYQKAVELVEYLKKELTNIDGALRQKLVSDELTKLKTENDRLKNELRQWQAKVVELETRQGIKQIPLPSSSAVVATCMDEINGKSPCPEVKRSVSPEPAGEQGDHPTKKNKKNQAVKKSDKPPKAVAAPKEEPKDIHVGRLNLKIGRIVSVEKHPDADSLYVEKIDLGEAEPRTIVSGLVKFVPLEEMQNRLVMVLCNLKPVKMRGITSEGMVMCASTPEKVEVLDPPEGSVPGDKVTCEGFVGIPDPLLNPKKKIFEQVAPDLKTDKDFIATYKGVPLTVGTKGVVKASSLADVQIK